MSGARFIGNAESETITCPVTGRTYEFAYVGVNSDAVLVRVSCRYRDGALVGTLDIPTWLARAVALQLAGLGDAAAQVRAIIAAGEACGPQSVDVPQLVIRPAAADEVGPPASVGEVIN